MNRVVELVRHPPEAIVWCVHEDPKLLLQGGEQVSHNNQRPLAPHALLEFLDGLGFPLIRKFLDGLGVGFPLIRKFPALAIVEEMFASRRKRKSKEPLQISNFLRQGGEMLSHLGEGFNWVDGSQRKFQRRRLLVLKESIADVLRGFKATPLHRQRSPGYDSGFQPFFKKKKKKKKKIA